MGRHLIGYEIEKGLADIDWFKQFHGERRKIGVAGYLEGGLIAFYAAAIDPRIDAALVSGYFSGRERAWEEPIYRNVWGMVSEYSSIPEIWDGPRPDSSWLYRYSGYKGHLSTPAYAGVKKEFDRIGQLVKSGFQKRTLVSGPQNKPVEFGSAEAFEHFAAHSESAGNALMFAMTDRALQIVKGQSFSDPVKLLDDLFSEVWEYGKQVTGNPGLRKTFALNALVPVDNAAWLLFAAENGIGSFDEMTPAAYRPGLSNRNDKVAGIPSFPTGTPVDKIRAAADQGYFIMKLKTGSPGTQKEMLEKDMDFLTQVHKSIGHYETPYTANGETPYYFDANARYEKKETLLRFLDHAKKIGAFDQLAYEKNIPCFCADLTVNPILVEWNKNVAARLPAFPGMTVGLQEANGHQYYKNRAKLASFHPYADAQWAKTKGGVFLLDDDYYRKSGGIFEPVKHYEELFAG